jgi:hypothetical protein
MHSSPSSAGVAPATSTQPSTPGVFQFPNMKPWNQPDG